MGPDARYEKTSSFGHACIIVSTQHTADTYRWQRGNCQTQDGGTAKFPLPSVIVAAIVCPAVVVAARRPVSAGRPVAVAVAVAVPVPVAVAVAIIVGPVPAGRVHVLGCDSPWPFAWRWRRRWRWWVVVCGSVAICA